jgi:hypothetical protein
VTGRWSWIRICNHRDDAFYGAIGVFTVPWRNYPCGLFNLLIYNTFPLD